MNIYIDFLSGYNYDIRKSGDARWIDQKCTYDVLSIIADCICEYVDNTGYSEFTVSDIWHSDYARENVIEIFSKPDPELKAGNEYDKYFGQPIKLLAYSKVLSVRMEKNRYYYSINNRVIIDKIALRPINALNFLYEYISKVLIDSDLINVFSNFFSKQNNDSYKELRDTFIHFTITYTKINGVTECGRIFTKVLNPLAFKLKKLGTEKGRISKNIITLNDLQYNRLNWRDELSGKDKSITRLEYEPTTVQLKARAFKNYTVNKAKKAIRKYNNILAEGMSEVYQASENVKATQVHHIFAQSEYPEIADYVENLIMLTPNQHFSMAHPNNNTQYIDRDFQYICLLSKSRNIYLDLTSENEDKFYDFDNYKYVLNIGFETDEFSSINFLDFTSLVEKIDFFYNDEISDNKYSFLIEKNSQIF